MNIAHVLRRLKDSSYWRDIAWLASGNAMAQAIGIAAMPLLTRLYSPQDFALQSLFLQVIGFAVVLVTWRYEYFVQLPKEHADAVALLLLVAGMGAGGALVATLLIWGFQQTIADLLGVPALASWLVLVPATAALMCLSIGMQNFVQRQGLYRQSSLSELANKASYVGTALAGYWIFIAPAGLILATAASALGKILWLSRTLGTDAGKSGAFANFRGQLKARAPYSLRRVARVYFRLSGSVVASHLLMSCTAIIPSVFIVRAYGTESLGQFALAASTIYLPSGLIGNAIGQVYYQRAAESWAAGRSFADLWRSTAKRLVLVGLPIYATLALVSPWVYPFVFGPVWVDAGVYAAAMAVSAFFSFISTPLDRGCLVVGAWLYIPIWHAARALSTALVAWLAWFNSWNIHVFVVVLVAQMSILFLIDYWAEYRFALRRSPEIPA